jgi:hypothetical protein
VIFLVVHAVDEHVVVLPAAAGKRHVGLDVPVRRDDAGDFARPGRPLIVDVA